jgi:hypothetical protein
MKRQILEKLRRDENEAVLLGNTKPRFFTVEIDFYIIIKMLNMLGA